MDVTKKYGRISARTARELLSCGAASTTLGKRYQDAVFPYSRTVDVRELATGDFVWRETIADTVTFTLLSRASVIDFLKRRDLEAAHRHPFIADTTTLWIRYTKYPTDFIESYPEIVGRLLALPVIGKTTSPTAVLKKYSDWWITLDHDYIVETQIDIAVAAMVYRLLDYEGARLVTQTADVQFTREQPAHECPIIELPKRHTVNVCHVLYASFFHQPIQKLSTELGNYVRSL